MHNKREQHISNIHSMPKETMLKYFNMTLDEKLNELLKYVDMGRIMEDTVVFTPGFEIDPFEDIPEERRFKELAPRLSYRGMGWSTIDPHMRNTMINGKKRAETIINNLKHKRLNKLWISFKKLLESLKRKKKKNEK